MKKIITSTILTFMICAVVAKPVYAPLYYPPSPPPEPEIMVASAYSRSEREGTANGITKMGTRVREGVVAVDPKIIPLGTELYIDNMGLFVAEDTGGSIKENRLDIYFESYDEAIQFGIQPVKVWIQHPSAVR